MLAALAFVPEPDDIIAFEAVSEDFPLDGQAVIDYFEDTYIDRLYANPNSFFKTTNLPEVILVTISLSVSYALEKP